MNVSCDLKKTFKASVIVVERVTHFFFKGKSALKIYGPASKKDTDYEIMQIKKENKTESKTNHIPPPPKKTKKKQKQTYTVNEFNSTCLKFYDSLCK